MTQIIERKEDPVRKISKTESMKMIAAQREKDLELVTGVFRYLEYPGGTLRFNYHKYEGDGNPKYVFEDGKVYRIPRMVARHINQNVHYMKYGHASGEFGKSGITAAYNDGRVPTNDSMYVVNKSHRCEFRSLEFMDEDIGLNDSNIAQVRKGL